MVGKLIDMIRMFVISAFVSFVSSLLFCSILSLTIHLPISILIIISPSIYLFIIFHSSFSLSFALIALFNFIRLSTLSIHLSLFPSPFRSFSLLPPTAIHVKGETHVQQRPGNKGKWITF